MSRSTDQVGRVLSGRYRLIAPVGTGASAQVFLADDVRLKRRVAVKVLHDALADDEAFLRRFRAEAQAAAALNHPNILAVYDWGDDEGSPVPRHRVPRRRAASAPCSTGACAAPPSQALLLGLEAARGLDYAHRRGFVHRDIKPANLLFGDDGRLRIADFGLARALAEAAWTEPQGAVLGTARYASPEQAQGEAVDGRADVYSLGLVLIEAVTGQVPFAADTTIGTLMARVGKPVEVPEALGPSSRVLERVGQPEAGDRPDAGELGVGLMAIAGDLPRPEPLPLVTSTRRRPSPPGPGRHAPRRRDSSGRATSHPPRPPRRGDLTVVDGLPGRWRGGADARRRGGLLPAPPPAPLAVGPPAGAPGRRLGAAAPASTATSRCRRTRSTWSASPRPRPGRSIQDADHGWTVNVEEVRVDGSTAGNVLRSDPDGRREAEAGHPITLFVSLGNTLADLPSDLAGRRSPTPRSAGAGRVRRQARSTSPTRTSPKDIVLRLGDGAAADLSCRRAARSRWWCRAAPPRGPSRPTSGTAPTSRPPPPSRRCSSGQAGRRVQRHRPRRQGDRHHPRAAARRCRATARCRSWSRRAPTW